MNVSTDGECFDASISPFLTTASPPDAKSGPSCHLYPARGSYKYCTPYQYRTHYKRQLESERRYTLAKVGTEG